MTATTISAERQEFDAWYESGGSAVMHGTSMTAQGQAWAAFRAGWDRAKHTPTSVLDGTISCRSCRAIVLETNADDHARWHRSAAITS